MKLIFFILSSVLLASCASTENVSSPHQLALQSKSVPSRPNYHNLDKAKSLEQMRSFAIKNEGLAQRYILSLNHAYRDPAQYLGLSIGEKADKDKYLKDEYVEAKFRIKDDAIKVSLLGNS